ncbi:hypothetical protein [Sinomonas humi]|uniref:hypothetical protein n=1 Tax=Sinomonas humi TaxID=1338436 RepID=UPI00068CC724|nr:hypothetical protein [Sinomonas humi]
MRTVLSALSVLLAVVLTAVAVPALWLDRNLVDESGFVSLLSPMSTDKQLQSTLVSNLDTAVLSDSGIPSVLRPVAQQAVQGLATNLVSDPGFPQAWNDTLRASHQLNFSPDKASANAFELELSPMAGLMARRLGSSLNVNIPPPSSLQVQVGTAQQRSWLTGAQRLAALSLPLALGAVLAFALGLLWARRRGVALAWAGIGLLLIAALYQGAVGLLPSVVSAQASAGSMSSTFGTRAAELAAASFETWILGLAICGAVFLVLGAVLGALRRRRRARTESTWGLASMDS